jgi:excisionase family DNA binding protein
MRANISGIKRPRVLSVAEAAAELNASEAYVRRLLLRQRLYGTKVGFVWAIYPDDLEAFKRMRRPPGRPRKTVNGVDEAALAKITAERSRAGTEGALRQRRPGASVLRTRRMRSQSRTKRG